MRWLRRLANIKIGGSNNYRSIVCGKLGLGSLLGRKMKCQGKSYSSWQVVEFILHFLTYVSFGLFLEILFLMVKGTILILLLNF